MSLANYTPPSRTVSLGGDNSFNVSGLSLQSIEILVRTHLPDVEELFELFMDGGNFTTDDLNRLALTLATRAPGFTANVIALGAGETDATANAARLPFPIQLQALAEIAELTFAEVGGIKKFVETVAGLLSSMKIKVPPKVTEAVDRMTQPSFGSTKDSDAM